MECTLEAETSVSNSTQYKLFIGDDKKYTLFGMTYSFNKLLVFGHRCMIKNIKQTAVKHFKNMHFMNLTFRMLVNKNLGSYLYYINGVWNLDRKSSAVEI